MKLDMRLSKRDLIILVVFVGAAIAFAFYQLLLAPMMLETTNLNTEIEEKQQLLQIEQMKLTRVQELRPQPEQIISAIGVIAQKYLPDNSVQYYYQLLNDFYEETGLKASAITTSLMTAGVMTDSTGSAGAQTSLVDAIAAYDEAMASVPPDTAGGAPVRASRYSFKYIPFTVELKEGDFIAVQDFIQLLNDLNYTMHIPTLSMKVNDDGDLTTTITMYFISIDRLSVHDEPLPEDMIYEPAPRFSPANRRDMFYYNQVHEDRDPTWLRVRLPGR